MFELISFMVVNKLNTILRENKQKLPSEMKAYDMRAEVREKIIRINDLRILI
jgi:hypothetical protein